MRRLGSLLPWNPGGGGDHGRFAAVRRRASSAFPIIDGSHLIRRMAVTLAATSLAMLALAPAANATFPDRNGRIVFQAQTDHGVQLFTMRPNGHDRRQITQVNGDATQADWSPDGRRIAFAFNECSVALVDPDGGNLTILPPEPGHTPGVDVCEGDPSFMPDGSRLVFVHFDAIAEVEQVWSMNLDGSDRQVVTGAGAPDPNVSPDGSKLSFKGPPAGALFVQNFDGSGLVQVSPTIEVAFKHDWAPDGKHLVFSDYADPEPTQPVNIATVRPDGTGMQYITHYTDPRFRAYVGGYSPDGQWIIFRLEDRALNAVYRVRPDGSDLHRITAWSGFRPRGLDWGPKPQR
jgi:Tol biopolymer transport system component